MADYEPQDQRPMPIAVVPRPEDTGRRTGPRNQTNRTLPSDVTSTNPNRRSNIGRLKLIMQVDNDFFRITRPVDTPCLVIDLEQVRENYQQIHRAFPGVAIHYAMKCNSDPGIIGALNSLGSGFEIASIGEARQLIELGVKPHNIICMHPIKSPEFLTYLYDHQVEVMAIDSLDEVDKIARYAPGSKLVVRVDVANEGSGWHLNGKYGLALNECLDVLDHIQSQRLVPCGLVFHVGSQCENLSNWMNALNACEQIWREARQRGIELKFLSLGGGLPVPYRRPVPGIDAIGDAVMNALRHSVIASADDVRLVIEPGRAMVASAGTLLTSVIGTAKRGPTSWAYIETGTYNGLVEAIETSDRQFYPLAVEDAGRPLIQYHIGGPTCVSLDTPFENVELPELRTGDRLYVLNAGAYTVSCAGTFNGFSAPTVYYLHDLVAAAEMPSLVMAE
jgi:ornithine decarboxylase